MIEIILKWLIPFILGGAATWVGTLLAKNRAYKDGLCCLLRAEIIRCHDKYSERGEIPLYAKESLEKVYKAYHKLNGNDVGTRLYNDTMNLPVKR